ncbi:MAG: SOS cell division inhibitor [Marinobacter sp.]|uniref:SOS cell division inhibitor n=1 Tax=unclassified Marinobacter TaxID=83889 RepID=UPI00273B2630|nr:MULTISPECIES: SOS cell division inhibitor [unclassified Marinobacter]MDP4546745.1 SOS cell division inhibitor [Marinobacter sp. MDS2]
MTNPDVLLADLDSLHEQLEAALVAEDWEALIALNQQVKPVVAPLMEAMEQGAVSPSEVKERLEALNRFVEVAGQGAAKARDEARQSLQGVNQNRNAAATYANVSSNRSK